MIDKKKIHSLVLEFIKAIGENPDREGLEGTPQRVADMCAELFAGLESEPKNLVKIFQEKEYVNSNSIIEIPGIPVNSICEHHFLPFIGTATIKYIPNGGMIMGLSKFARVVDYFARKPQLQERLTREIAEFLHSKLDAKYVSVSLECEHMCMSMRAVKARGVITKTRFECGKI